MSGNHNSDCACDNVVSREIIDNDPQFEVVVSGDYVASDDDAVIRVKAGQIVNGVVVVPRITLADPTETTASVTIIAQGGDVLVAGIQDGSTRTVAADSAIAFWPAENETGECECPSGYWIPECCALPT